MEPVGSGGGGGTTGSGNGCYSYYGRLTEGRSPGEGGGKAVAVEGAEGEAGSEPAAAAAPGCWKKGFSGGAPPRGPGHRPVSALGPCSNLKVFLERDLSKERHELLKDQRLYRNQARKHSIETNKRRRALEEKWKEDEEKEQKFREQILLQRKLKLQEATEKFQRGHLPSSQRKRGVQRKPEPKLDEALQKIQSTGLQLSSLRVIERNDPFHWKQGSAKAACSRIKQESNRANPDRDPLLFQQNLDEMQQQLQKQHFSNLQDLHQEGNEARCSESVCSVDSLEAGEPNGNCVTPSETSSLSAQLDSSGHNSQEQQRRADEADITFSKNQHVNNWLRNLNTSAVPTTSPFRDILIKYNVVPSDEDTHSPGWKSSVLSTSEQTETERCASDGNLTFAKNTREGKSFLLKHPSSGTVSSKSPPATDTAVLKLNKAWTIPNPSPLVASQLVNSELQDNTLSPAQAPSHHVVTSSSAGFLTTDRSATAHYSNSFLLSCLPKGKEAHAARCTEDTDYVADDKDEKYVDHVNIEASLFEETHKGSINQQKDNREEKVKEIIFSVPHGGLTSSFSEFDQQRNDDPSERKVVKLPKSILKKGSKYEAGCFKAVVVNRGIRFGPQPVSAARDSVELAKIKGKDADIQKNGKKLRWFDEIDQAEDANDEEKCSEQSVTEITESQLQSPSFQITGTTSGINLTNSSSYTLNSAFLENPEENSEKSAKLSTVGGAERDNVMQNAFLSPGYHVAKEAWMAPRTEEIIPILYNGDPKNSKTNPRKGRMKIVKRPKSAKAQPSASITKNRKGTIIRPQSANEATKVIKTQGKLIVPHPPWKPLLSKRPDENSVGSTYRTLCKPHADTENGRHLSEGQDLGRDTEEGPSPSSEGPSHTPTMQPSYSVFTYAPLTKAKSTGNTTHSIARCNSFPKRNSVHSGNGLCPNRTPTDEEITILWQGVHHALAQKDGAAGDSQHNAAVCNNTNNRDLQPTRPNVAHITIDGGNLIGNIKSGVRANAAFSSQPSTSVAFARRKQIIENNANKRKALLEQRRQMAASAGQKPNAVGESMAQAVKHAQSQCAYEQVAGIGSSEEVSDSMKQFLLAENLVNLSATESEILTGLDTAHPYNQTKVLNRPLQQGMSALSFEEHKVLQSLDRINQKLHDVQEKMNRNPASTGVFQTISPLVTSPSYMDLIPPTQRYKSITNATGTLRQKRY
uniref:Centrosomal protein of 126 kDa isoform X1 n=1 Tax=Pogona vitticeps TaxID=103695 RepID=A0A6J0TXB7_9SAUR